MPAKETRRLVALLGHPVAHSRSPAIWNAAFRAAGLDWEYVAIDVPPDALARKVRDLAAAGAAGANVTIPHKTAAAALCDALDADAAATGAVNTLAFDGGRVRGANTDVAGFRAAVRADLGMDLAGRRVVIIGRGGAARAVRRACEVDGAEVAVVHRGMPRAEAEAAVRGADLLVNATPVGWKGEPPPVEVALLPTRAAVLDLVYRETPLVAAARARGLRAADGRTMLLEQAAGSFRLLTGIEAPRAAMRAAFE